MKNIEKFLELNGKKISILMADGTWYIAVRPICEVLNVDYHAQYKSILSDDILAQLLSEQTTVAADGKLRKMLCLPEQYVYGWLFSIRSNSPELKQYKKLCYDILYRHFHGALTGRMNALNEKTETELEIIELQEKLDAQLSASAEFKRIQELRHKQKQITKTLKDLDAELLSGQLSLFN